MKGAEDLHLLTIKRQVSLNLQKLYIVNSCCPWTVSKKKFVSLYSKRRDTDRWGREKERGSGGEREWESEGGRACFICWFTPWRPAMAGAKACSWELNPGLACGWQAPNYLKAEQPGLEAVALRCMWHPKQQLDLCHLPASALSLLLWTWCSADNA